MSRAMKALRTPIALLLAIALLIGTIPASVVYAAGDLEVLPEQENKVDPDPDSDLDTDTDPDLDPDTDPDLDTDTDPDLDTDTDPDPDPTPDPKVEPEAGVVMTTTSLELDTILVELTAKEKYEAKKDTILANIEGYNDFLTQSGESSKFESEFELLKKLFDQLQTLEDEGGVSFKVIVKITIPLNEEAMAFLYRAAVEGTGFEDAVKAMLKGTDYEKYTSVATTAIKVLLGNSVLSVFDTGLNTYAEKDYVTLHKITDIDNDELEISASIAKLLALLEQYKSYLSADDYNAAKEFLTDLNVAAVALEASDIVATITALVNLGEKYDISLEDLLGTVEATTAALAVFEDVAKISAKIFATIERIEQIATAEEWVGIKFSSYVNKIDELNALVKELSGSLADLNALYGTNPIVKKALDFVGNYVAGALQALPSGLIGTLNAQVNAYFDKLISEAHHNETKALLGALKAEIGKSLGQLNSELNELIKECAGSVTLGGLIDAINKVTGKIDSLSLSLKEAIAKLAELGIESPADALEEVRGAALKIIGAMKEFADEDFWQQILEAQGKKNLKDFVAKLDELLVELEAATKFSDADKIIDIIGQSYNAFLTFLCELDRLALTVTPEGPLSYESIDTDVEIVVAHNYALIHEALSKLSEKFNKCSKFLKIEMDDFTAFQVDITGGEGLDYTFVPQSGAGDYLLTVKAGEYEDGNYTFNFKSNVELTKIKVILFGHCVWTKPVTSTFKWAGTASVTLAINAEIVEPNPNPTPTPNPPGGGREVVFYSAGSTGGSPASFGTIAIGDNETPLANIPDEEIPLGKLPSAGGLPIEVVGLTGVLFLSLGVVLKKKKVLDENDD